MGSEAAVTVKTLAQELGVDTSMMSPAAQRLPGIDSTWASQDTEEWIFALAQEQGHRKNRYAPLRTAKSQKTSARWCSGCRTTTWPRCTRG